MSNRDERGLRSLTGNASRRNHGAAFAQSSLVARPVAFGPSRAEDRRNKHGQTGRARMRPGTLLIGAAAAAALAAAAVPQPASAQTYTTQDVHFICAFAAG